MTLYNREEFLHDAIKSVINSTYENWELIITDDGSTDKSFEIALSYSEKDKRIKVYKNDKNLGDYPNRNHAASLAKGKYLKYVDADDMIYPFGLEQLVYYMELYPEAGFGLCSIEQDIKEIFPMKLTPNETYTRHYINGIYVFHKAPLSSIIRRDVFVQENGFANVRHYGDGELWHRLAKSHDVVLMPHGIVWYRVSDGQEASIRKKNPLNISKTFACYYDHLNSDNCPLNKENQKKVVDLMERNICRSILRGVKSFGLSKAIEMYKYRNFGLAKLFKSIF